MSRPVSYKDALEDCLNVMRGGGDLQSAVSRYPQHETELRDDVRIAYALRRAAVSVVPPAGAETRASLRLANALREARTEAQPARRAASASPFGWLAGALRPLAVVGVAAVALVVFGLGTGNISNPLGGASRAEASTVEGVVVENRNGTLTLETPQGLTKVDLNQKPTIQDDTAKLLTISDIEAGQVVRIEAKKTAQGLVARQVDRKPIAALQNWCTDNGDACREVAPRLEAVSTQCKPGDQQCARIQQSVSDVQKGLQALQKRIQDLKTRCEGRETPACRQLMQVCKDHPVVCADLKIRPPTAPAGGAGGLAGDNQQGPQQQRPQNPQPQRPQQGPSPRAAQ
jgi:hypothetical protein